MVGRGGASPGVGGAYLEGPGPRGGARVRWAGPGLERVEPALEGRVPSPAGAGRGRNGRGLSSMGGALSGGEETLSWRVGSSLGGEGRERDRRGLSGGGRDRGLGGPRQGRDRRGLPSRGGAWSAGTGTEATPRPAPPHPSDYHRCVKRMNRRGKSTQPCEYYFRVFHSLCPKSWVSRGPRGRRQPAGRDRTGRRWRVPRS